jgi:hypothetical protein
LEEYIGQPVMKFCPDEEDLVLEIFKTLGSGNTIKDVPVRFRRKDGRIIPLLIDSNVNYKADGSFNHTRCFIRDDTGRKQGWLHSIVGTCLYAAHIEVPHPLASEPHDSVRVPRCAP